MTHVRILILFTDETDAFVRTSNFLQLPAGRIQVPLTEFCWVLIQNSLLYVGPGRTRTRLCRIKHGLGFKTLWYVLCRVGPTLGLRVWVGIKTSA